MNYKNDEEYKEYIQNQKKTMKKIIGSIIVIGLILITGIFTLCNISNERVQAGYAGYVYNKPIFGPSSFEAVLSGPNATGLAWRKNAIRVSVTPYTMNEQFSSILAKDKLPMECEAYLVYQLDSDPIRIREFIEKFGGINQKLEPDEIAKEAYEQFIQQPFRTEIRNAISKFDALEASSNLPEITKIVEDRLTEKMAGTPFKIVSIVVGKTTPPTNVVNEINLKVAKTQELQRKAIEFNIKQQEEAIQEAEGRASAKKAEQIALGQRKRVESEALANLAKQRAEAEGNLAIIKAQADGQKLLAESRIALEKATGENIIRMSFIENMDKIKLPHILVGSDTVGLFFKALQGKE